MRIAIAQLNQIVGDLEGNRMRAEDAAAEARRRGAGLLLLPELALTGYPPMDLLEREGFIEDQLRELDHLAEASREIAIVTGAVIPHTTRGSKRHWNAGVLLAEGEVKAVRGKSLLPTYDVFDEKRYFERSLTRELVQLPTSEGTVPIGIAVCEDTWVERVHYETDPAAELAAAGARLLLNPSCSPFHAGKSAERRGMLSRLAKRLSLPLVFCNQVGGNDELIFDGGSCAIDAEGRVHARLPLFEEALEVFDFPFEGPGVEPDAVEGPGRAEQLARGLTLGIRDYFLKQDLPPGAVVGLSGGIDSALTAYLAVQALGADRVLGVAMPGPFSSEHSIADAQALAAKLGIDCRTVDIRPVYEAYLEIFRSLFGEKDDYGLTQQNIQSRIRGATLMAVSNQENRLVLATGNKSELSVGYCTLYGDTVGGLAVLGDVYKRDVYAVSRWANREREIIPWSTIEKAPSAELAPDQLDSDDLPPYEILDPVLEQCIEGQLAASRLVPPEGCSMEEALRIRRRLDRNEYKRRQNPLVLRTSPKAFGSGRRLPIVHRYHQ